MIGEYIREKWTQVYFQPKGGARSLTVRLPVDGFRLPVSHCAVITVCRIQAELRRKNAMSSKTKYTLPLPNTKTVTYIFTAPQWQVFRLSFRQVRLPLLSRPLFLPQVFLKIDKISINCQVNFDLQQWNSIKGFFNAEQSKQRCIHRVNKRMGGWKGLSQ